MRNFEFGNRGRNLLMAATLAGAVALAGCSGQSGAEPVPAPVEPSVSAQYYTNGLRVIHYHNDDHQYADILEFCDGPDLVEQTVNPFNEGHSGTGNALERTPKHPACADGRLDAADFE